MCLICHRVAVGRKYWMPGKRIKVIKLMGKIKQINIKIRNKNKELSIKIIRKLRKWRETSQSI